MEGNIEINGRQFRFTEEEGLTIAMVAERENIEIPRLCNREDLGIRGNCRICMVELKNEGRLVPACSTPVRTGMVIETNSPLVQKHRKTMVELLLANHNRNCPSCEKNKSCQLQKIADALDILQEDFEEVFLKEEPFMIPGLMTIRRDRCVRCGRCKALCNDILKIRAIGRLGRGWKSQFSICFGKESFWQGERRLIPEALVKNKDGSCILCGKCTEVCPVGCLNHDTHLDRFWSAVDEKKQPIIIVFFDKDLKELQRSIERTVGFAFEKICGLLKKVGADQILEMEIQEVSRIEDVACYSERIEDFVSKYRKGQSCVLIGITSEISYKVIVEVKKETRRMKAVLLPSDVGLLRKQTMWDMEEIKPWEPDITFI